MSNRSFLRALDKALDRSIYSLFDSDIKIGKIDFSTGFIVYADGTTTQMTLKQHNDWFHSNDIVPVTQSEW